MNPPEKRDPNQSSTAIIVYLAGIIVFLALPFLIALARHPARVRPESFRGADDKRNGVVSDKPIYVGISSVTGKTVYTTAADAPGIYSWPTAMEYCENLEDVGHDDWRLPDRSELDAMFLNRAAIGGFGISDSASGGWYWSANENDMFTAWAQRFSDGNRRRNGEYTASAVRCITDAR